MSGANAYFVITTGLFFWLFAIWTREGVLNMMFKCGFLGAGIAGLILTLASFGYVFKV